MVSGYLGAAEELGVLLVKLVRVVLLPALPAVTLHHPLRLHVVDETEQPVLPCNKRRNIFMTNTASSLPGATVRREAQFLLGKSEQEGSQVTARLER